jgi:hypothetical protein
MLCYKKLYIIWISTFNESVTDFWFSGGINIKSFDEKIILKLKLSVGVIWTILNVNACWSKKEPSGSGMNTSGGQGRQIPLEFTHKVLSIQTVHVSRWPSKQSRHGKLHLSRTHAFVKKSILKPG